MSTTGVVTDVTPVFRGGTLTADVTTGDVVLLLDDAADFAEDFSEPRYLAIGANLTPREYVAVANDEDTQESVTLAVALPSGVSFEADLPVVPWDPEVSASDKRAVEFKATVRLDGQGASITATAPHHLIPLVGATQLVGASVQLAEGSGEEWIVEHVLGRAPNLVAPAGTPGQPQVWMTNSGGQASVFWETDPSHSDPGSLFALALDPSEKSLRLYDAAATGVGVDMYPAGKAPFGYQMAISGRVVLLHEVDMATLADGGARNTNSGTKYVRAGADGGLFASTSAPSSRSIKHDIQPLEIEPDALLALQPVTFRYNEAPDIVRAGFIAEDADELGLGLWVGYEDRDEPDKPTGFDYDGFVPALLALVQRQQQQIGALTERVAALEA